MKQVICRIALVLFVGCVLNWGFGFAGQEAGAQVAPPPVCPPICVPPPPPPPAPAPAPDTVDHGGHRGKIDLGSVLVNGAVCMLGGIGIDRVADVKPSVLHKFSNAIVCNGVALVIAGPPGFGGLFGLVATQTICCGSQSIVLKSVRPGGWTCQSRDRTDGCAQWVSDHSLRVMRHHARHKRAKHRRLHH